MILEKVYDELMAQIEDLKKAVAGMSGGSDNYDELSNRPKVNNITLSGNKKSSDLKIAYSMTEAEYAAATKNAESIYCLQENAGTITDSAYVNLEVADWVDDSGIYKQTKPFVFEVTPAAGWTIEDVTIETGIATVDSYEVTADPFGLSITYAAETLPEYGITATVTVTINQPAGATRIMKNGIPFGSTPTYTKLWDYKTDNNNSVLYGASLSATLHDAAENYDALILNLMCVTSDESDANWKGSAQCYIDMYALAESFQAGHIIYQSNSDRASHFYIHGTTLQKIAQAPPSAATTTNGLVNVIGIKF